MEVLRCSFGHQVTDLSFPNDSAYGSLQSDQQRDQAAMLGFPPHHFQPCVKNPLGFAWIGSCFSQCSRSSASASAESNDAADLSPGTSGKSWKDRDLFYGLTRAVSAVQCPKVTG